MSEFDFTEGDSGSQPNCDRDHIGFVKSVVFVAQRGGKFAREAMGGLAYRLIVLPRPWIGALLVFIPVKFGEVVTAAVYNTSEHANKNFVEYVDELQNYKYDLILFGLVLVLIWVVQRHQSLILQEHRSGSARREEAFFAGVVRRYSPFRSISFRYVAYVFAVYGGRVGRWLMSSWRPHVLGIVAFAALGILRQAWIDRSGFTLDALLGIAGDWNFFASAVVAYGITWIAVAYWRGRNKLLILATVNHAGDDFKDFADGLELRIMNWLKRLADLHSMPDRATANHSGGLAIWDENRGGKVSDLRIGVDDDIARFASLIDDSAAVRLGPAKVPLRPLFNLFSTLTRGNPLRTSLHRHGTTLLLAAELAKGGVWRIEREIHEDAPDDERAAKLEDMLTELVYSVFRSLPKLAAVNWRPLEHLSKGVRALRDAQENEAERYPKLREAEEHLLKARGLTPRGFDRCSYLLGIVYVKLEELSLRQLSPNLDEAANWNAAGRAAFTRALQENPQNVDAAYAIAFQSCGRGWHYDKEQYAFAVEFADRMIGIKRSDARAWNVRGVALRALRQIDNNEGTWLGSVDNDKSAAQYLWSDLCVYAWSGEVPVSLREDQSNYLTNLGLALKVNSPSRAQRILRQAMYHNPASRPAFELAKILDEKLAADMRRQFRYFPGLRKRLLSFQYRKPPAENMYMRAIFASNKIEERTQIRVYLAASLLNWSKKASENAFFNMYYDDRIREALVKLIDSPSLIRQSQWKTLSDVFHRFSLRDELQRYLPDSFYILSKAGNVDIVLWTTLYDEAQIDDLVLAVPEPGSFLEGTEYKMRSQLRAIRICLRKYVPPRYLPVDSNRNPLIWIRGLQLILQGTIDINKSIYSPNRRRLKYLQLGIARMKSSIRLLDNEYAFPREDMLIKAYATLSNAELFITQFDIEPNERATQLTNSLANAEKVKARAPFEARSYIALGERYKARLDLKSAEEVSGMGQSLSPGDKQFLLDRASIHFRYGQQIIVREQRMKYFDSVIKLLESALSQLTYNGRGDIHFWLGQFYGVLCDYDKSRAQFQISTKMNCNVITSCIQMASHCLEQEQFEFANSDLSEAMHHIFTSYRKFSKEYNGEKRAEILSKWLSEFALDESVPDISDREPIGYLLPYAIILKALVRCEQRDFRGAQRHLESAARFMRRCPLPPGTSRDAQIQRRECRRFLNAQSLDVRGRINLGLGDRKDAVRDFEKSLMVMGNERTAYQLADLAMSDAEGSAPGPRLHARLDEARRKIDQTRIIDIRAVYEGRLAKLEQRFEKLRKAALKLNGRRDENAELVVRGRKAPMVSVATAIAAMKTPHGPSTKARTKKLKMTESGLRAEQ